MVLWEPMTTVFRRWVTAKGATHPHRHESVHKRSSLQSTFMKACSNWEAKTCSLVQVMRTLGVTAWDAQMDGTFLVSLRWKSNLPILRCLGGFRISWRFLTRSPFHVGRKGAWRTLMLSDRPFKACHLPPQPALQPPAPSSCCHWIHFCFQTTLTGDFKTLRGKNGIKGKVTLKYIFEFQVWGHS